MVTRPCEHCANLDKEKYLTRCRYIGAYKTHKEFVASTFDAPCVLDEYKHEVDRMQRRNRWWFFWLSAAIAAIALKVWFR